MKNKKYLEKEIYAERKASVHWYCNHKFRHWFYEKLTKYYQNKYLEFTKVKKRKNIKNI